MGFQPKQKIYRLNFEDPEFNGLVVMAKSAPIGMVLDLIGLAHVGDISQIDPEQLKQIEGLFDLFADRLEEWNVEFTSGPQKGRPVPATREGVRSQDGDFVIAIILAWIDAIMGVSGPLPTALSNGGRSPVPPLPMEERSPSP